VQAAGPALFNAGPVVLAVPTLIDWQWVFSAMNWLKNGSCPAIWFAAFCSISAG
jgi:hypothetical protein